MAKPERRDLAKEAFWRRMLLRFGRSKSTARDFCFEHELSEANFYAWRRVIARRDREAPGSSAATVPSSVAATSPVFVKVRVADAGLADLSVPTSSTARNAAGRCVITEVNWPLCEGPHSPAGRAVSVDEEAQADYLARYYLLTGEMITGEEAERLGMVSKALPRAQVLDEALRVADGLASGSQQAIRWTKRALNNWLKMAGPIFDQSAAYEMLCFMGPDVLEGAAALSEKRAPRFPSAHAAD